MYNIASGKNVYIGDIIKRIKKSLIVKLSEKKIIEQSKSQKLI